MSSPIRYLSSPAGVALVVFGSFVALLLTTKLLTLVLFPPTAPYLFLNKKPDHPSPSDGHHIVITGGSSGIGLEIAKQCARMKGVSAVTIVARDLKKMEVAKALILEPFGKTKKENKDDEGDGTRAAEATADDGKKEKLLDGRQPPTVTCLPLDLASCATESDFKALQSKLSTLCTKVGSPPTILFNCAGTSVAKPLLEAEWGTYLKLNSINYLGTALAIKLILPLMIAGGVPSPRILITSSGAGQIGLFGYTAYSPSKFALSGLAQSLQMEMFPFKGFVTLAFPPNTDTPGFELENVDKPEETRKMEDEAGLWKADVIAKGMIEAACSGRVNCYFGLEGWMLNSVTAGMGQVDNAFDFITQCVLGGLLRFVGLFYLWGFRGIVEKVRVEKLKAA
jgi:3-dehydrosphinganine reductase